MRLTTRTAMALALMVTGTSPAWADMEAAKKFLDAEIGDLSTLSRADQRRAAKFFADADEAQQVRMSKSDSDNAFWARYKNFATTAEAYCAN